MRLALIDDCRRPPRTTGERGICECCGFDVIAKCGDVIVEHWAHKARKDCDQWYEPESHWHKLVKSMLAPESRQEVVMIRDGVKHRADAILENGTVVEVQKSMLTAKQVRERESFYQSAAPSMMWLLAVDSEWTTRRSAFKAMSCLTIWADENGMLSWTDDNPSSVRDDADMLALWSVKHRRDKEEKEESDRKMRRQWEVEHSDMMPRFTSWAERFRIPNPKESEDEFVNEAVDLSIELVRKSMPFKKWTAFDRYHDDGSDWLASFVSALLPRIGRRGYITEPEISVLRKKLDILSRVKP